MSVMICESCCRRVDTDFDEMHEDCGHFYCECCHEDGRGINHFQRVAEKIRQEKDEKCKENREHYDKPNIATVAYLAPVDGFINRDGGGEDGKLDSRIGLEINIHDAEQCLQYIAEHIRGCVNSESQTSDDLARIFLLVNQIKGELS